MINAVDVRVGNLVMWGIHICKIEGIHTRNLTQKENKTEHFYISGAVPFSEYYCVYPNDIEPIVLSPDILEKCGFRKTQEGNMALPEVWSRNYQKRVVINTIDISIRGSDEIHWIEGNTIVELYSLHQLQNLVHALTGEELSINL